MSKYPLKPSYIARPRVQKLPPRKFYITLPKRPSQKGKVRGAFSLVPASTERRGANGTPAERKMRCTCSSDSLSTSVSILKFPDVLKAGNKIWPKIGQNISDMKNFWCLVGQNMSNMIFSYFFHTWKICCLQMLEGQFGVEFDGWVKNQVNRLWVWVLHKATDMPRQNDNWNSMVSH